MIARESRIVSSRCIVDDVRVLLCELELLLFTKATSVDFRIDVSGQKTTRMFDSGQIYVSSKLMNICLHLGSTRPMSCMRPRS